MIVPPRSSLGSGLGPMELARGYRDFVDGPELFFACYRCIDWRRRWKIRLWIVLLALLLLIGVLSWTGLL